MAAMMAAVTGQVARVWAGWAVVLAAAVATSAAPALADDRAADARSEARAHYEKATAAYALGRFAEAAAEFEQAFTLKPDPALLYNAAQAYRLAGSTERALQLYRSYLRVYGRRADHASDVEWHIGELEKLGVAAPPPASVERAGSSAAGSPPLAAAPPSPPAASLVAPAPAPRADGERPIYERWWFWAGAGAVVAAVVVGVVLATRKPTDCGPGVDYCANTGL
jgi:iron complex outermembrane receptor protein